MFELISDRHRQNDRICAPVSPNEVFECRKTASSKCMAKTGFIHGNRLLIVWFEVTVVGEVYLGILKNSM